ncbi:MAG: ESX secretion-associated protein EspG [Pseudonocardiaceae bacterium]
MTLTSEQYDICWADLNLSEQVYPLRIRSHGRTHEERADLRRRVYEQLAACGLGRGQRLEPELRNALTLLAHAPVRVDMQWLSAPGQTDMDRAVGARSGERGLVARLDEGHLRLMPCRGTALLLALVDQLPRTEAAPGQSITMPRDVLVPSASGGYATSPTTGRFRQPYRAFEEVLSKPRLRGGQIVANARDQTGRRHRSRPVQWFDTDAGRWTARILPAADGGEHLTLSPADRPLMVTQVAELLERIVR